MERIIDTTAAVALPAPPVLSGTTGYFTEGSPGVTPATRVRAWWVNMVQEELLALLTAAGVAPDATATNFTQVLQSIRVLSRGQNHAVWKNIGGVLNWSLNGAAFTTTGAASFVPAYSGLAKLRINGAGGGTGGAAGTGASGGGAAGSHGEAILTLTAATPIAVAIGLGGIAGGSTVGDGGTGGSSIFGPITAPGGFGSLHALTGSVTVGGLTGGPVTGGAYFSKPGNPGGSGGSIAGAQQPGQGGGTPFAQPGYANINVGADEYGAGSGGCNGAANGNSGGTGVAILEW